MGLYERLFKPNTYKTIDLSQYENNNAVQKELFNREREQVMKSNPKGKAYARDTVYGLDGSNSKQADEMYNKGSILNHKQKLRRYSNDIIVQSIIRTRYSQVAKYARPAHWSNNGVGFEITPKEMPKSGKPNRLQAKRIKELEEFIYHTGKGWSPNRETFAKFLKGYINNKYIYDQINVELVREKDGKLHHFNSVDAGTVILAKTPKTADEPRHFKQYTGGNYQDPIEFSEKEMTFVTSNPNTDVTRHGYGYSEVEASLNHLNYHIDTEQFNARFFAQGGTTRGILIIDTGASVQQNAAALQGVRRQWQTTSSGLSGAWKIPMLSAKDAKFVNMTQTSKDMEFERWLNYLINIICSVFQIQPDEINFPNRGGGSTGKGASTAINEGSSQQAKMKQSQDKGLQPLMASIEDFINNYILEEIDSNYRFSFTLGDAQSEKEKQEIINAKLANGMTVNEARKEMGLAALNSDFGDLPGEPTTAVQFLQVINAQDKVMQAITQNVDTDPNKNKGVDPNNVHYNENDKQNPEQGKDKEKLNALDNEPKQDSDDNPSVDN